MDLHPIATAPTPDERQIVDDVLGACPADAASTERSDDAMPSNATGSATVGLREAEGRRHLLLPALHAVQDRFGWISPGALGYVCDRLHVPPAEGFGVASFYALFALAQRPPVVAHVCDDIACKTRGADRLIEGLKKSLGEPIGSPPHKDPQAPSAWMKAPCLGLCEQAPAALVVRAGATPTEHRFGDATVEAIVDALAKPSIDPAISDEARARPAMTRLPQRDIASAPPLRLLRRIGVVDPRSLDDYRAHGGFSAMRRALAWSPSSVIREVTEAGLLGRGGAAFPTGRKWDAVAKAPSRPKWVVGSGDESEPGTFKDRILMEDDPFAVVESMILAGYAVGAERGLLYVRDEYPLARERLSHAIAQCKARGFLGEDVMGRGARFELEIRRGAGAYICGEETALLNSIEGFRGEPRTKPPFPADHGLFGQPTLINNIETLLNVLDIVQDGAEVYRRTGTATSSGTRLFCLSGCVERPGLYEVPFGMRLDALIDLAGGVLRGRKLRAVLLGGAASSFVTPSELALPLTVEDTRKIGASLGSGVVLVLDDSIPVLPILERVASFFRDESCGQCVPCRVGTVRQEELVSRLVRKKSTPAAERALLADLGQVMRDASICGLGQTASLAVESAFLKLGPALDEELS